MKTIGFCLALALAGCTPAALTSLDANHPASPQAAEAPARNSFKALALERTTVRPERDAALPEASRPPESHPHSHGGHDHDH